MPSSTIDQLLKSPYGTVTDKDLIQGRFDANDHKFDQELLPPNVVADEDRRKLFKTGTYKLQLKDQRIYPDKGKPWYVTVTGTITIQCDNASIAPGKKEP
jgi:hypothetical protein